MSNEFELIFDSSSVRESLGLSVEPSKTDAVLKLDTVQWLTEPPSVVPSEMVKRIESDSFVDEIAGPISSPEIALGGFDALAEFRKAIPLPAPKLAPTAGREMSDLLRKLSKRAQVTAHWNSEKHETKIREIVDQVRNSPTFERVRDDEGWDALVSHSCDLVCSSVLEACGDK